MRFLFTKAWLKSFSSLFINIAAAWFMSVLLGLNIDNLDQLYTLFTNFFSGIIYLLLAVKIEEIIS